MAERKKSTKAKSPSKSLSAKVTKTAAKVAKPRAARRKSYVVDLRIHSPASLGYLGIEGIDTAPAMVRLAKVKGLDIIAVADFHSGAFIDRVVTAAEDTNLIVLPGVSLRCKTEKCQDVILLCLFPETCRSADVENFLLDVGLPNNQFRNEGYTLTTPFEVILKKLEEHNGLAIPSRMDKTPHRMNAIGELIEKYGFRSFDLAYSDSQGFFDLHWPKVDFNFYSFSNASALAQVGNRNSTVKLTTPTFEAIKDLAARDLSSISS